MHRQHYATCRMELEIQTVSPLLIQAERAEKQKGEVSFYRAIDPADGQEKYCIPATSLKGVWRSAAERILRTSESDLACDPFEEQAGNSQSCSKRLEKDSRANSADIYAALCPACRLFGSTAHAGLIQITDGWIDGNQKATQRTGIAIDRFTGGVKHGALYTVAPLPPKTIFPVSLTIHNMEFWQIGLLALVFREMDAGRVRLGSGTRQGFGHVKVRWQSVRFRYPKLMGSEEGVAVADGLRSAQHDAVDGDSVAYPTQEAILLEQITPQQTAGWRTSLWTDYRVEGANLDVLRKACVDDALATKLGQGKEGFAYSSGGT